MKPIAIFRFSPSEGPGGFAEFLDRRAMPWRLFAIDAGEGGPGDCGAFSGLCLMGGPMSVNDPLPWIAPLLDLIRQAVAAGVPVVGHCLGGQLMAKALGAGVSRNTVKEIGWGRVEAVGPMAEHWLGETRVFDAFHWHGESFALPPGATLLLSSPYCAHQAFVLGPHLAMQCHVEMTEAMIRRWSEDWIKENATPGLSVQTPAQMLAGVPAALPRLRQVATRIYETWAAGLARD